MMTDPISDMLTRIRNAKDIYKIEVNIPYSKMKEGIAKKLKQEGFIKDHKIVEASPQNTLKVFLKYGPDGEQIIQTIKRISKPGCRVYKKSMELKTVLSGLGFSIVSTSRGILTNKECREQKVGGEVLCQVW